LAAVAVGKDASHRAAFVVDSAAAADATVRRTAIVAGYTAIGVASDRADLRPETAGARNAGAVLTEVARSGATAARATTAIGTTLPACAARHADSRLHRRWRAPTLPALAALSPLLRVSGVVSLGPVSLRPGGGDSFRDCEPEQRQGAPERGPPRLALPERASERFRERIEPLSVHSAPLPDPAARQILETGIWFSKTDSIIALLDQMSTFAHLHPN
jgi:hypothetical protein